MVVIIYVQAGNTVTTTVENLYNTKSQHDVPRFTTGFHLHINWLPTTIIHHTNKYNWWYQLLYPFRVALLFLFSFMSLLPSSSFNTFIFSLFLLVFVLLGTRKQSNLQWSKMYVIRILRQPSPVQLKIDQNNCRMWNISPMWVINDARRTRQIKSRQTQHITRRLFTSKLDLN